MNVEKPYLPVLILNSDDQAGESDIIPGNAAVALQINSSGSFTNKDILAELITGTTPFLLLFANEKSIANNVELSEQLKLSLFSKNYIRQNNKPVIAFLEEQENGENSYSTYIASQLMHQGWPELVQWKLPSATPFTAQLTNYQNMPFYLKEASFSADFLVQHFFSDLRHPGTYIFFCGTAVASASSIEEQFSLACEAALSNNPVLKAYVANAILLRMQNNALQEEHTILRERLANAEHIINIIRTKYKDDYDILFEWYQKEYEVLPLWFKRTGHIVKFLMGKRSFRSFYSDDEKKKATRD